MSTWMGTGALALWIDVDPALSDETDAWYVDEHLPDRVFQAGYARARRYRAVQGGPRFLSLFDTRTPEGLVSDGYLALVKEISEQSRRIRAGFMRVMRNTFRVRYSRGLPGAGGCVASLALRPEGAASRDAIEASLEAVRTQPCIVGVHWLEPAPEFRKRMDGVRAVGQGDASVGDVLLIECTQPEDLEALRGGVLSTRSLAELGWAEENYAVYQLLYDIAANEEPKP
jgi:hypothetical protein